MKPSVLFYCLLCFTVYADAQTPTPVGPGEGSPVDPSRPLWVLVPITDPLGLILNWIAPGTEVQRVRMGTLEVTGNVAVNNKLTVRGDIVTQTGGVKFSDGTVQKTAQLIGPTGRKGDKGDRGADGETGPAGPSGALSNSIAVCQSGVGANASCGCGDQTVTRVFGACQVTSDTGTCFNTGAQGCCAVCAP
jgi:hypothetical protein